MPLHVLIASTDGLPREAVITNSREQAEALAARIRPFDLYDRIDILETTPEAEFIENSTADAASDQ